MMLQGLLVLSLGLAAPSAETWIFRPRLIPGQEMTYGGTLVHASQADRGAVYEQVYVLRLRALVLSINEKGAVLVGCETRRGVADFGRRERSDGEGQFYLDRIQIGDEGQATWASNGARPMVTPESVMTSELGYLIALPTEPVAVGHRWLDRPDGQAPIHYTVEGTGKVADTECVVITGRQAIDSRRLGANLVPGWQVALRLWVDPETATVFRLERVITSGRTTWTTKYEMRNHVFFHGPILQDHSADFLAAAKAQEDLSRVQSAAQADPAVLQRVAQEVAYALEKPASSPYRPILKLLSEQLSTKESAAAPAKIVSHGGKPRREVQSGQPAPNFIIRVKETGESLTPKRLADKPYLLVGADPQVPLSLEALRAVLAEVQAGPRPVDVYVFSDAPKDGAADPEAALRRAAPGPYIYCLGQGMDRTYGVQGVPHLVAVDHAGAVQLNVSGWGPEILLNLRQVLAQLR